MRFLLALVVGVTLLLTGLQQNVSTVFAATIQESDVNKDGSVSILDLSMIAGDFGGVDPRYDLDGDGKVSILDISIANQYFGQSYPTFIINPTDNPQTIINAAPPNSLFIFSAGTHRATTSPMIVPRPGDAFSTHAGAILSGAKVLSSWTVDGSTWRADGQTQPKSQAGGFCRVATPSCNLSDDLFIDNNPLYEVLSYGAVVPGTWYFDDVNDKIYIGDNPAGKTVEVSQHAYAIDCGNCDNVHIYGLTVEKFSNRAQSGAIDGGGEDGWTIERSTLRWNHGAGYSASNGSIIMDNTITKNGQLGLHGSGTSNLWVEDNEISYNNYAGFSDGWEAGGFKFATGGDNIYVFNNWSHHNDGPGMWTDYVGTGTIYRGNLVEYNTSMGIEHEISYSALIYDNLIRLNSSVGGDAWAFGAGIMVQNSSNVEVYNNRVVVGAEAGDGITVVHQNRPTAEGPRTGTNNYIHNNEIWHLGSVGQSGIFADCSLCDPSSPFYRQLAWDTNVFNFNIYHVPSLSSSRWETNGSAMNWAAFQAAGQEANGTADTVLTGAP